MQLSTLWKRTIAGATGLSAIIGVPLLWHQVGWPTPAWSSDIKRIDSRIDKIVEAVQTITLVDLRDKREFVEDRIDELEGRLALDPDNGALKELVKLRYRERDEIDRQIDGLQQ